MAEARIPLASLHGGVSTQPAALRYPSQVAGAENVLFSAASGALKRPGSEMVFAISGLGIGTKHKLHAIHRDASEKYLMVYGPGLLRIFQIDGAECPLSISPAAAAYIAANGAAADDLRPVTIADYTLLINRTVPVGTLASQAYTVTGSWRDFDVMASQTPADKTYHRARTATVTAPASHWQYVGGTGWARRVYGNVNAWFDEAEDSWDDPAFNPAGFTVAFQRVPCSITAAAPAPLWREAQRTLTKAGAFTNYTWQAGDQIRITGGHVGGVPVVTGWYNIASRTDASTIVLAEGVGFGGDSWNITAGSIGRSFSVEWDFYVDPQETMEDIALAIQSRLREAGAADACVAYLHGAGGTGRFEITAPWRGAGVSVYETTAPANASTYDHSLTSGRAFYGGSGTAGSGGFAGQSLAVLDRWRQVAAPSQPQAVPDGSTMPIQIVRRTPPGPGQPAQFEATAVDWVPRYSGDHETNPALSLWAKGARLADIAFHRNRLMLCGNENVVFSAAGDFFNFFRENAAGDVLDGDPIDIALSSPQVTLVEHAVPFRKGMVIFTAAGVQFEVNDPEAFTPNTASVTPSTAYANLPGVRPVVMGAQMYFPAAHGGVTQMMEYYWHDTQAANMAADVTAHVAGYLPDHIQTTACCLNAGTVFALTTKESY